jgi:hypothetical protein
MCWRRKVQKANIPPEIRHELERHGELAVQMALTHPFDVPTSPLSSMRHKHREHALAWLVEKREMAERKESRRYLWILLLTVAATAAGILAAFAAWIGAWSDIKALLRAWL